MRKTNTPPRWFRGLNVLTATAILAAASIGIPASAATNVSEQEQANAQTCTSKIGKTSTTTYSNSSTDPSTLPDHIVNGDFEYLPSGGWQAINKKYSKATKDAGQYTDTATDPYAHQAYTSVDPINGQLIYDAWHRTTDTNKPRWGTWAGFSRARFAWVSSQTGGTSQGGVTDHKGAVELQEDNDTGNTYAEIVGSETHKAIYQDVYTQSSTAVQYRVRLKHASLQGSGDGANLDKLCVMIGAPGSEKPVLMNRIIANGKGGDTVQTSMSEASYIVATATTNHNQGEHDGQWETYEGVYTAPANQPVTRFTFAALNELEPTRGNIVDDIQFTKEYPLKYDLNGGTGSLPPQTY